MPTNVQLQQNIDELKQHFDMLDKRMEAYEKQMHDNNVVLVRLDATVTSYTNFMKRFLRGGAAFVSAVATIVVAYYILAYFHIHP